MNNDLFIFILIFYHFAMLRSFTVHSQLVSKKLSWGLIRILDSEMFLPWKRPPNDPTKSYCFDIFAALFRMTNTSNWQTSVLFCRREYGYRKAPAQPLQNLRSTTTIHTTSTSTCCLNVRFNRSATPCTSDWILRSHCAPVRDVTVTLAARPLTVTICIPQNWLRILVQG